MAPLVNLVLDADGLRWKIWLVNDVQGEAGGVLLFDDETAAKEFYVGPFVAELKHQPALSSLEVKQFDVMETDTRLTYGPIGEGVGI